MITAYRQFDLLALREAERLHKRVHSIKATLASWNRQLFTSRADYAALASSNAEGTLLGSVKEQPWLPAGYFDGVKAYGRRLRLQASGVLSTTGTPTLTFQARLGATAGSSDLSGASVGVSGAITTGSSVTNAWWQLALDLVCSSPGIGAGAMTLTCNGAVYSPTGFASPFVYPLEPTTPNTATWTQTFDASISLYFNLSATWSASSSSNTITLKDLLLLGID